MNLSSFVLGDPAYIKLFMQNCPILTYPYLLGPSDFKNDSNSKEIEDEEHVLMKCQIYDTARNICLQTLYEAFPIFQNLCDRDKFIFILTCSDYEVTSSLSTFLNEIKQIRGNI